MQDPTNGAVIDYALVAVFVERAGAEAAASELRAAGWPGQRIALLGRDDARAGAVAGALTSLGVAWEEARRWERELGEGRTLVVVQPGDRHAEAFVILQRNGGHLGQTSAEQV